MRRWPPPPARPSQPTASDTPVARAVATAVLLPHARLPTACAAARCAAAAPDGPRPQEESGQWNSNLALADLALNIAFSVEMVLRVVTVGSVWQYIRRPWNLFDTLMVFAGYTVFLPTAGNAGANGVRALRALRALRPLRTVTQLESLRSIVVCFLEVRARAEGRRFGGGAVRARGGVRIRGRRAWRRLAASGARREPRGEWARGGGFRHKRDGRICA